MANTLNPDSTPFHDGYRFGKKAAEESTPNEELQDKLATELETIADFDDQEAFAEGFWTGTEFDDLTV